MPRFILRPLLVCLAILSGCSRAERPSPVERVGADQEAIINGQLDTTHQAVVAVLGNGWACSGTILQVSGNQGYVLTAAHCCPPGDPPKWVVIGNDYNNGQSFNVVQGSPVADPCYQGCAGSTDDVCMLKFSGASASTPVIPAMTLASDALTVGTAITYVGYGITSSPPGGGNSRRRSVQKAIGALDNYFVEYGNPGASGTCEGDSGGPGLVVVGGVEQVASVTSYGDQACTQLGASVRTSRVYDAFIKPYLQGQTGAPTCPVDTDCTVCSQIAYNPQCGGDCSQQTNDCLGDPGCSALVQCYSGCGTISCENDCNTQHVDGLQKYEAITACLCTGSCATVCHAQLCSFNKCGMKPKSATASCATCAEDSCCAESWTCSQDASCKACFTAKTADPSCAQNPSAQAYYQCVNAACTAAGCALNDINGGSSSSSSSSSSGSTGAGGTTGSGGSGAGGAASSSAGAASGGGGPGPDQQGGCAVAAPTGDDAPALPLLALAVGAALARRRRRAS